MWNRIANHFKSIRVLFGFVALGGLLVTSMSSTNLSGKLGQIAQLGEGMQICFSRVGQSFTARMLGDMKSPYLNASFFATTEECIGDVIYTASNELKDSLGKTSKSLNMLASNIHWFHEKVVISEDNGLIKVSNIDIENRFVKLETDVEEFLGKIDEVKTNFSESNIYLQMLLWMFAFLAPFLFVWEFYEKRRLVLLNNVVEGEALIELSKNEICSSDKVRGIIGKALDQNSLLNCSKLFNEFSLDLFEAKPNAYMPVVYDEQENAKIDEVINESTHLSGIFSDVVSSLSDKLFGQEIFFDIDINEKIYVQGPREPVEQALFYLISDTMKRFDAEDVIKRILVKTKTLGGTTVLVIEDTTSGFGEDVVVGAQNFSIDLKICQEVAKDFAGTLLMENIRNKRQEIKGSKIQLVFKTATVQPAMTNLSERSKEIQI